jgi:hypothetical protein
MGITPSEILAMCGLGTIVSDTVDDDIRRMTRYDEWHYLADKAESEDHCETTLHYSSVTRATIVVRPRRAP